MTGNSVLSRTLGRGVLSSTKSGLSRLAPPSHVTPYQSSNTARPMTSNSSYNENQTASHLDFGLSNTEDIAIGSMERSVFSTNTKKILKNM